ncbi:MULTISPECIES: hypothetical protein [Thermomonas]|jgi:hypothetical protein|uniref:hypothetical protein n=1 Tax=Thermomonas TaxID=141948 RepID=UPI0004916AD4|nr:MULTISPECIES: hypothetical protein [Thermomonas]
MSISKNHVSRRLRDEALSSIDAKYTLLENWARNGIPLRRNAGQALELEWFPTSLRTFCAWDGSQNDKAVRAQCGLLRRNAFQTLTSDAKRLQDVKALLKTITEQAIKARKRLDPRVAVDEAEERIRIEREKRAGALLGYRRARQEARELRASLFSEQRAHKQSIEQMDKHSKQQDKENADLRRQVAELTDTLRKTTPIRRVR